MRCLSDVAPNTTKGDANSPRCGGVPREGSVDIRMLLCGDINGGGADDNDIGRGLCRAMHQDNQSVFTDGASLEGDVSLHGQGKGGVLQRMLSFRGSQRVGVEVLNFPYWDNWGATVRSYK